MLMNIPEEWLVLFLVFGPLAVLFIYVASRPVAKDEEKGEFKSQQFKVTSQKDPYTYRTTKGGGFEFQALKTNKTRTKGKWYKPKGGLDIIKSNYESFLKNLKK